MSADLTPAINAAVNWSGRSVPHDDGCCGGRRGCARPGNCPSCTQGETCTCIRSEILRTVRAGIEHAAPLIEAAVRAELEPALDQIKTVAMNAAVATYSATARLRGEV